MARLPIRLAGDNGFVLLISCAGDLDTGGGLCVFDGAEVKIIDRVSTGGLTVFEGRLARLLRAAFSTGGGEIVLYDHRGISHYLRVDELWDAHYLTWDGRNFIVASTGDNSLVWVTPSGEVTRRWTAPGEYDCCHLNEGYLANGRLYGCAFTKSQEYRGYKHDIHQGAGFVFELESGRAVIEGLSAPHNPRFADDVWTVCDSLCQLVRQFDAKTGREIRRTQVRSFARGLARTDDFWIVGESSPRGGGPDPQTGSFAILRAGDLSFVTRFELPFREISDIVVAPPELAQAAMTGFRTNPLRVAEADQLALFRDLAMEPRRLWAVSDRLEPGECRVRVDADLPRHWSPGKLQLVPCTVTNLGERFLCSELPHPVYISYKWTTPSSPSVPLGEGLRNRLPRTLAPGESVRCYVEVKAPDAEGPFQLILTLVQEGVCWFDSINIGNACRATIDVEFRGEDSPSPEFVPSWLQSDGKSSAR